MNKFERIEQLRDILKLSREDYIRILGIKALSNYSTFIRNSAETSMRDDKLEILINKYNINLNWLYTGNPPIFLNELDSFSQGDKNNSNRKTKVLPITLDSHGNENIIFVPVKAQAGYLLGFNDPDYVSDLQAFNLPGFTNATFRMFEVNGPSMHPTLNSNDLVIGEYVESFDHITSNRVYVIISKNDGVVVKRVLSSRQDKSIIYLNSDNKSGDYPAIELNKEDIKELWYVRAYISKELAHPEGLYKEVVELKEEIQDIKSTIRTLKG